MELEDTRERALPLHSGQTLEDYLVYLKHVAMYDFAGGYGERKAVLDLGCGEGYGSQSLASTARVVVGVDHSFEAVAHAREKYARAGLVFAVCDVQSLPFRSGCFDTVVSFEVIEHVDSVRRYLEEIKRVSTQAGLFLVSTPNRLLRLLPFQKPWNRFHRREYDYRGLRRVLGAAFGQVQMCGVTADPLTLEIEKRRVKQNPFTAYPRMIAQLVLPSVIYDFLARAATVALSGPRVFWGRKSSTHPIRGLERAEGTNGFDSSLYKQNSFQITDAKLEECITLVALCRQ